MVFRFMALAINFGIISEKVTAYVCANSLGAITYSDVEHDKKIGSPGLVSCCYTSAEIRSSSGRQTGLFPANADVAAVIPTMALSKKVNHARRGGKRGASPLSGERKAIISLRTR